MYNSIINITKHSHDIYIIIIVYMITCMWRLTIICHKLSVDANRSFTAPDVSRLKLLTEPFTPWTQSTSGALLGLALRDPKM